MPGPSLHEEPQQSMFAPDMLDPPQAVKDDWYFQMYVDDLPVWGFIGEALVLLWQRRSLLGLHGEYGLDPPGALFHINAASYMHTTWHAYTHTMQAKSSRSSGTESRNSSASCSHTLNSTSNTTRTR